MKGILLLFSLTGLFLQAGTAKVTPLDERQRLALQSKISPRKDGRPHSAPEDGAGLTSQTSLSCLKWVAGAQRKRAETIGAIRSSESRPQSAGSGEDRPESTGSGTVHATVKIKGAKDRPVKATFVIGGREKSDEETEKKGSRAQPVMGHTGTILEEQAAEDEEDGKERESSCMESVSACCGRFVKFVVGLAVCL